MRALQIGTFAAILAVAMAAPLLMDCSGGESSTSVDGGREGGVAPRATQIRFTYDPSAGKVRLHVTTSLKVDAQTVAFVKVRKGTLRPGEDDTLDCSAVQKGGFRIEFALSAPKGGERVFAGPQVPQALLTQFYEEETIGPDATPAQLAAIEAGTDPIVEGCVFQNGEVLARGQATVFRAWDEATPDLVERVAAYEGGGSAKPEWHSVVTYGQLCERELGENPFAPKRADGTYDTYDCVNGKYQVTVPITVTDNAGNVSEPNAEPERCDRPDWLRGSCAPYTHVGRAENANGTRWVVICRKPPTNHTKNGTSFNDIGLLGHNPKTGKTCFFQNALYGKTDATRVANPADPRLSETTWSSFNVETCNHCHDSDAFAHSPWLDQARAQDNRYVVPRIDDDPDFTRDPKRPYSLVGMRTRGWSMKRALVSPEVAACTSCHRIGAGNTATPEETSYSFADRSVGADPDHARRLTAAFQRFEPSHWMPPGLSGMTEQAFAASPAGRAIGFIRRCKSSPNDPACNYEDIPR